MRISLSVGVASFALIHFAFALPPPSSPFAQVGIPVAGDSETSLAKALFTLLDAFPGFVNVEMHPQDNVTSDLAHTYSFKSPTDKSLESCLEELSTITGNLMEHRVVNGYICLLPDSKRHNDALMNSEVSLELKDITTWEAMKSIAVQVNAKSTNNNRLIIRPARISAGYSPPASFLETRLPEVSITKKTVREALCRIMAASPCEMSYAYLLSKTTGIVELFFFKSGGDSFTGQLMSEAQFKWWRTELESENWRINEPSHK